MEKESVHYQLPFDNGKKERISISYNLTENHQIRLNDGDVTAEIDYKDLDWIIDVLYEVRSIHKENTKEKK